MGLFVPFHLAVFYSLPSSERIPDWSGVSGIRKLLGMRALQEITHYEDKGWET
jgi:hypothetical protein